MSESVRSMLLAPVALWVLLGVALVLTLTRPFRRLDAVESGSLVHPLLIGVAWQCAHFVEEFATGLAVELPGLFGLVPLSDRFFVAFNLFWIAVWLVSAVGIRRNIRAAYFPVWFFALGMFANGVIHPLLAVWVGGYFPGLFTAPVAGVFGFVLIRRLSRITAPVLV